ncbi:MAG TPA: hypothetical protein VGP28_13325 [Methylocella sp.]|nr:hypothetical protein [Methylocella sp.]
MNEAVHGGAGSLRGRRARVRPAKVFFASIRVQCFEARVMVIVVPLALTPFNPARRYRLTH